ncbi:hypothetical protein BB561_007028 [Smittium simulii]|uniref:Uncharacterized protein n=1 Tax=Smittium simulii TaxID=133385 RepID=A0A2T9XXB4_9FUNG|nr:hypothetical protein BB561_007028 [Smittium simulii]
MHLTTQTLHNADCRNSHLAASIGRGTDGMDGSCPLCLDVTENSLATQANHLLVECRTLDGNRSSSGLQLVLKGTTEYNPTASKLCGIYLLGGVPGSCPLIAHMSVEPK